MTATDLDFLGRNVATVDAALAAKDTTIADLERQLAEAREERDGLKAIFARKQFRPNDENAMDVVDELGAEGCTREAKLAAVTEDGKCLICGLPWIADPDPLRSCPHDEIQVIAFLRTCSSPYVDCICPGCPRKTPMAWMSGMCEPCADADCEHTDGAKAVAAELATVTAERDRLAAVLETQPDDVDWMVVAKKVLRNRARLSQPATAVPTATNKESV